MVLVSVGCEEVIWLCEAAERGPAGSWRRGPGPPRDIGVSGLALWVVVGERRAPWQQLEREPAASRLHVCSSFRCSV